MRNKNVFYSFILFLLLKISFIANAERTRDKMYNSIIGANCFRRLNGTHQTGCSSKFSGSVGVLHVIEKPEDFDFIVNNPPAPPYAPVIPPNLFTRENILRLKNDARTNVSVIVLVNKAVPQINFNFSHELQCPNQNSGQLSDQEFCNPEKPETIWNPYGTGLLQEDFPFPILYVFDPNEVKKIVDCFNKYNNFDFDNHKRRSLCSIQVQAFMSAAVNTEVCIRRSNFINNLSPTKYCDPLEGRNVYATLFPRKHTVQTGRRAIDKTERFIIVSCRLDTTSMFEGINLGAMDSLISYATLINVAHVLNRILPEQRNYKWNILYVIFDGESYDYIGSQRLVYDMQKLLFPPRNSQTNLISFENIDYMIDLGVFDDLNDVRVYHASDFKFVHTFLDRLKYYNKLFDFNIGFRKLQSMNLPPTSAQSFLKANISFPAMILHSKPENKFYHSVYDDSINIGFTYKNTSLDFTQLININENLTEHFPPESIQMKIRNISSAIALSLYTTITEKNYVGDDIANPVLVDEFLYCFLESSDCPLFKAASHPHSLPGLPRPPDRYVNVGESPKETPGWTYRIIGFITSQIKSEYAKENCSILPLYWFAGFEGKGECHLTTQNGSEAYSPAFFEPDYDWKSGKYSTWTESRWNPFSARIFLKPSKIHEAVTLTIGFVVMILSFVIVFLINSKSDVLFENTGADSTSTSEPAAC